MALYINTNISSLVAQNSLTKVDQALSQNQERLSTGLRINSAADDAAGLAISNNFTAQIRGMNQAVRNGNDGISFTQTAEGATKEITENLQRMRELAVQSANGLYDSGDGQGRPELQEEFEELQDEITRIAQNTSFNQAQMLVEQSVGGFTSGEVSFQVGAGTSSHDRITLSLSSGDMQASSGLSVGSDTGGGDVNISTESTAKAAITSIDDALQTVNSFRSNLGAVQNRLSAAVSNLENGVENQTESRSRLQDADIAKESAEMTQNNVLRQAGTAMLSQANQNPQLALQLLGGGA